MRMHILRHVPFEEEGAIGDWADTRGFSRTWTDFSAGGDLPDLSAFDWLVVMGGPMSVHDELQFPWLRQEKRFLGEAIRQGKTVVGICLGAQLLAEVLGGEVTRSPQKEIGWFPVELTREGRECAVSAQLPQTFPAFHWHGETFSVPPGAVPLASSRGCPHQGFLFQERVLGLQFHLEVTPSSMEQLIENCGSEIGSGPFVQTVEKMRARSDFDSIASSLQGVLDALAGM
jgi:GMP synthase-like glutamine amidotransferase